MELIKDLLIVVGRIFTIIPLLLIVTLYMGKRAIGELLSSTFSGIVTQRLANSFENKLTKFHWF